MGNLLGVALGPVLTNAHPYTAYGWFVLTLVSTCGSHSGYDFFGAEKHDEHHEFFDWNFGELGRHLCNIKPLLPPCRRHHHHHHPTPPGVGPVCDNLFGTSLPKGHADASRAKTAAMLARRDAKAVEVDAKAEKTMS